MLKKKINIIFAGTTMFSLIHVQNIFSTHHSIKAILTKRSSIHFQKKNNIVQNFAIKNKIPYFLFENFKHKETYKTLKNFSADLLIVVSYGLLIPQKILKLFPKGAINLHASLLPRWRGAAPIQWAILSGDKETGISAFYMKKTLDTGNILYSLKCPIEKKDTYITLYSKLLIVSLQVLYQILYIIEKNITPKIKKQNLKYVTYAPKIFKKNTQIYWNQSAKKIERQIRAFYPSPNSFFLLNGIRIKVLKTIIKKKEKTKKYQIGEIIAANKKGIFIQTKKNILILKKIQIENKKSMDVFEVLNSKKKWFLPGLILQ
ncbi:Methionyl-tRNA formyltransferase [Buchnera aphidicola (Tuberolachnus salignus)]|uniref:Methionyl-tRNA formyltransferase n=1 Tax=Buchnera aphidicola subsp. Tuberolachnus salignus TaxID=98804 RepID=A0A160SYG2_BUCTT|nr:methionyl-tRNA formyltransferase [Buchnera aphidicola]CUR53294.1 Methionyl-tRNA formyltransferase [Buchnera aphidicola (Tuberolachnus salignus)]